MVWSRKVTVPVGVPGLPGSVSTMFEEADGELSPSAFSALTCIWYRVLSWSPVIAPVVAAPPTMSTLVAGFGWFCA